MDKVLGADTNWMPRVSRLAICLVAVQFATAGGCAFGRKPYANDPLIHLNRAVWGARDKSPASGVAGPEPIAPSAPSTPLVGSQVTSRP